MTTVFIHGDMTELDIYEKVDQSTRFVIMEDHYPLSPYAPPGSEQFIYDLFKQFPDCTFVTAVCRPTPYENEVWFPFYFMQTIKDNPRWIPDFETVRPKTANAIGGQTRIARTLSSFWLAKHYPREQLLDRFMQNDSLDNVIRIIENSTYYNKKHLHPKKFLLDKFVHTDEDIVNKIVLPDNIAQSYLAFVPEATGVELGARMTEGTYLPLVGGNLYLPVGNYQVHKVLEQLGFDMFTDVFKFDSLNSDDRYRMSIGVLEDNKAITTDHQIIEQIWFDNTKRLAHNHNLTQDLGHFMEHFKPTIQTLSESLQYVDLETMQFLPEFRNMASIYFWLKDFSQ